MNFPPSIKKGIDKVANMDTEETKAQIVAEMSRVKKTLYKEEVKSAVFAVVFAMNLACVILNPFTFITFIQVLLSLYMIGFFKPTVKKQIQLQTIMTSLKEMLHKVENPPEPPKPSTPWKT